MIKQSRNTQYWLMFTVLSIAMQASFVTSQAMCPIISDRYVDNRLASDDPNGPDFREVSGLAFSPTQTHNGNPIFFAISDGGGDARIGIFDSESGKRLKTLKVDRGFFRNSDWESLTIGSCGRSGQGDTCLYIMDAGDNTARRNSGRRGRNGYRILKVREPKWKDYDDDEMISKSQLSRLDFDYRHSSSPTNHADCEAMFLDHKGWGDDESVGDVYLATKWDSDNMRSKNRLFQVPASAWSSGYDGAIRDYSVKAVGSYDYSKYKRMGGTHFMKTTWTFGEMSFDGTMIALGNLQKSFVFLRCPGTSVADTLVNPHANSKACLEWSHPASGQVESFAWTPDRRYTLDIPEGNSPKMGWTKMRYDKDESSRVCPREKPTPNPTQSPTYEPSSSPTLTVIPTGNKTDIPTNSPTECAGPILDLVLHTDQEAALTQWKLYDETEELVAQGKSYPNNVTTKYNDCLQPGMHTFEISNQMIDGVPGWYQIWYDKTLLYDSRGEFGSWTEIVFSSEVDGNPVFRSKMTPSPTQAPISETMDGVFGVACGGICPGSQLANAQEVVIIGSNGQGNEYLCGALDKRYQHLFATADACDALQVSAQQAGCKCQTTTVAETSWNDSSTKTKSAKATPTAVIEVQDLDDQWVFIVIGIATILCIVLLCCCKQICFGREHESSAEEETSTDTAAGNINKKSRPHDLESNLIEISGRTILSDDATAISGSDFFGSSEMMAVVGPEQSDRTINSDLSNSG